MTAVALFGSRQSVSEGLRRRYGLASAAVHDPRRLRQGLRVDQWHGHNAFIREGDRIFRSYFVDARGDEALGTTWSYPEITALGRQEAWEDSPEGHPQSSPYQWWNYHDAYGADR